MFIFLQKPNGFDHRLVNIIPDSFQLIFQKTMAMSPFIIVPVNFETTTIDEILQSAIRFWEIWLQPFGFLTMFGDPKRITNAQDFRFIPRPNMQGNACNMVENRHVGCIDANIAKMLVRRFVVNGKSAAAMTSDHAA